EILAGINQQDTPPPLSLHTPEMTISLRKRRFPLRVEHKPAIDPRSGELLPQPVDHVSADFAEAASIENAPSEPEA
ncbi:hypothetical protein, partial [Aeromonas allosaccharophila]|uniref:hypothetical protein n=1 Tax=Aeromonas allosaccharophila TaxID=656 RepID=UPI002B46BF93